MKVILLLISALAVTASELIDPVDGVHQHEDGNNLRMRSRVLLQVPPVTLPPIGVPPVTLPPIGVPPVTLPPIPSIGVCTLNASICLDPALKPAGPTCCTGKCVDTSRDNTNCLFCNLICPLGTSCCNYLCTDFLTNPLNCGKCGVVCPSFIRFLPFLPGICRAGVCL